MVVAPLLFTLLCASPMNTPPPKSPGSSPAAARSSFLREYAQTRRYLAGRPVSPLFSSTSDAVFFLRSGPTSAVQTLHVLDVVTGQSRELLTAEQLLSGSEQTLSAQEKARLERQRISARGFTHYSVSPDGKALLVTLSGKLYLYERDTGKTTALNAGAGPIDPQFSPDGRRIAYVRAGNLYVLDRAQNRERQLTRGGSLTLTHGLAEFVAQEEMGRSHGFWWSPDSQSLAYEVADSSKLEQFSIVDPMHPEAAPHTVPYPRPGKRNAEVRLGVLRADGTGKTRWVPWDEARYPYLATVVWPKRGGPLTLVVQNREQTEEQVLAFDETTGKTRVLLTEKDEAWLNLDQDFPHWLDDGSGFLWLTERNGGPEVELRGPDGARRETWVAPASNFSEFVGWDSASRTLYFLGGGDPAALVLHQAKQGQAPQPFLKGTATGWQAAVLSDDGSLIALQTSTLDAMPQWRLYRAKTGERVAELPSVALEPPFSPNVERRTVRGAAGVTFQTLLIRPRQFQRGTKYPVIVSVYGGPRHQEVQEAMGKQLLEQHYADQGFIVVKIDGRGTPRRGRDWERAIKFDFAGPTLDDQVEALQALGKELPELDLTRVGVEGWSFGGYMSALAVLRRPDVFHAAVSGAPVTEWRDYDTHYTERYLGLPDKNQDAYDRSSLLPLAPKLARPLLLVHGTADDNVYFLHTLKLSDALFRAGKRHEVLPLSGLTHMVPDPLVTERLHGLVVDYFRQHLGTPKAR